MFIQKNNKQQPDERRQKKNPRTTVEPSYNTHDNGKLLSPEKKKLPLI